MSLALSVLLAVLSLPAGMLAWQDPDPATPKSTEDVPQPPALPAPTFADPLLAPDYQRAIEQLKAKNYDEARKQFRALRGKVTVEAEIDAIDRCVLESEGGLELNRLRERALRGDLRGVLAAGEKLRKKYTGTIAGFDLEALLAECEDKLYWQIENFEKSSATAPDGDGGSGEGGEGGGGDGGGGGGGREGGQTGFGLNTSIVSGDAKDRDSKVREGKQSLLWRTTRNLTFLSFDKAKGAKVAEYRYLHVSIRAEDPKLTPQLLILFDCEEGGLGGDGGGGRGGGPRGGAARAFNRTGFRHSFAPKGTWQDLRLDLKKFETAGEPRWDEVTALRFVHLPGGEGRIYIDNLRLEKE
ncbi:MAG: hypothetical protein ACKVX7_11915 [Planctomycetota bacterium]